MFSSGYKVPSVKERMAQMKENHMARKQDRNEIKKNTNAVGFQLFEDEDNISDVMVGSVLGDWNTEFFYTWECISFDQYFVTCLRE